jgi:hypothetical protein
LEKNPKAETRKPESSVESRYCIVLNFGIWSLVLFRISEFEIRICNLPFLGQGNDAADAELSAATWTRDFLGRLIARYFKALPAHRTTADEGLFQVALAQEALKGGLGAAGRLGGGYNQR